MKLLLAAIPALLLVACAPSTPQARIEAAPWKFKQLSPAHQELVKAGRIDKGMSPDAVYLAWGNASSVYEGQDDDGATLRWDYVGSRPVVTSGFSVGYGSGWGYGYPYRGRYGRYPYSAYGVHNDVAYIPYKKATVWFENRRVSKWERRK